ncbi:SGNH/GDSL hydrolase family protein [Saccharospirillum salsuginis]|uniref:SGNH hydrolase-type esterase domain-containing protein n=1 Tax=Saccharospirillum salsuginis TaxID=418750 RepID=A0A918NDT0_9GAMM|nr:SGNH/GDSL hydrolase family protein [Saccharospirillum salsuginis]GGX59774.1 hypothetical protein GCM10007392_29700 [Saccharospirillum salsuginis]
MPAVNRHRLTTLALSPLLLAQAVYVRKVTPRLPEPEGDREGIAGTGQPLNLLILGDSAAAGVGVKYQSEALSGRLVDALSFDFRVRWTLLAKTGLTLDGIIELSRAVTHPVLDVAVISAGVNDVTGGSSLARWREGIGTLYDRLHTALGCRLVIFTTVPPMQDFPALPTPLRQYLGHRAVLLNEELRTVLKGLDHAALVDPDFAPTPDVIAVDGFHPGFRAYRVWADALATLIRHRLGGGNTRG